MEVALHYTRDCPFMISCHIYAKNRGYVSIQGYVVEHPRLLSLKIIDDKSTVSQPASNKHAIASWHRSDDDDEDTDPNPCKNTILLIPSYPLTLCHTLPLFLLMFFLKLVT